MAVTSHPDIEKHLLSLAEDLRKKLEKNSGVSYKRKGATVTPKKDEEAAFEEYGSATMKKKPKPFVQKSLKEFAKDNKIKGL